MARAVSVLPAPSGNTLASANDLQLINAMILLQIACNRGHSAITRRREEYFCYLGRVLNLERQARGLPAPPADPHVADLNRL